MSKTLNILNIMWMKTLSAHQQVPLWRKSCANHSVIIRFSNQPILIRTLFLVFFGRQRLGLGTGLNSKSSLESLLTKSKLSRKSSNLGLESESSDSSSQLCLLMPINVGAMLYKGWTDYLLMLT